MGQAWYRPACSEPEGEPEGLRPLVGWTATGEPALPNRVTPAHLPELRTRPARWWDWPLGLAHSGRVRPVPPAPAFYPASHPGSSPAPLPRRAQTPDGSVRTSFPAARCGRASTRTPQAGQRHGSKPHKAGDYIPLSPFAAYFRTGCGLTQQTAHCAAHRAEHPPLSADPAPRTAGPQIVGCRPYRAE